MENSNSLSAESSSPPPQLDDVKSGKKWKQQLKEEEMQGAENELNIASIT